MTIAENLENRKMGENTQNPLQLQLVVILLYHLPGFSFFTLVFLQGCPWYSHLKKQFGDAYLKS